VVDTAQRDRIRDELKGVLRGELLFDELSRSLYSTDASLFRVEPLGAVTPRDEDDVRALVRYAAEHQIALIPRGAGTGLAGESLGRGLIVDLSRNFRSIVQVDADRVRVQPGVVCRTLNAELARHGRRFAPDPASGDTCTIGGMLATNASGSRALRHGYTRDHVLALRAVWDSGDADEVSVPSLDPGSARLGEIASRVSRLLESGRQVLADGRPRTPFDRCGYLLHDALTPDGADLTKVLVGSEGTLALFTEAVLRTVPLPGGRSLVLLGFATLDEALRAARRSVELAPAACELLDRRLLTLARSRRDEYSRLVPAAAEAILLVEFERDAPTEARAAARELIDRLQHVEPLARLATAAYEPAEIDRLWAIREAALPSLYGLTRGPQPVAFVEDTGVPVEALGEFLPKVQDILQRYETTASFLVHAAAGQVHTRPFLDLSREDHVAKLWAIAEEVHALALALGGTVSTQHGTGIMRTPWVARQHGKGYPLLREVKSIFDPNNLFNPGKIIGPDPNQPAWPLRPPFGPPPEHGSWVREKPPEARDSPPPIKEVTPPTDTEARPKGPVPPFGTALLWAPGEAESQVAACNGCGECRTESPARRMCPMFRATHQEAASPRAKPNMLRALLQPGTDTKRLSADDVRAVADLCVNCKMCARECPAHVNVPKLMIEAKSAHVAEHGLARADWVLARAEGFAALGSLFAIAVNPLLGARPFRWLMEKMFGVSRHRRLPAFAVLSFIRRARLRGWTRGTRAASGSAARTERVALFVDVFANYNDPSIAEAAVAVLRHNGVEVLVPHGQVGCGMSALAQGDVETARESAHRNLRVFAELAREGYRIVCTEPTAALTLRQDYLDLLDDPDALLVADHTVELTTYLTELRRRGLLRADFRPVELDVGHHVPCHVKALGAGVAGPDLLAMIPRMRVHTIDVSCSGMAGTFGLKAANYERSLAAGRPMIEEMKRPRVLVGSTECSSCRMQMEEGSGKRTLHPVQYMALAYGLMPELAQKIKRPLRPLVSR
jgi:FAD/FMN-containing dehydrogenase/Fe-S oxidoreductase